MKTSQLALPAKFKPPSAQERDPRRRHRTAPYRSATQGGTEIEKLTGGGFNTCQPKTWEQSRATVRFLDDHYGADCAKVALKAPAYKDH